MNDSVPGETSIVDNNVDFATTKLGCALDKLLNVVAVQHVTGNSQGAARLGGVDRVGNRVGLCCLDVSRCFTDQGSSINQLAVNRTREWHILASISAITTLAPSLAKSRAASAPIP